MGRTEQVEAHCTWAGCGWEWSGPKKELDKRLDAHYFNTDHPMPRFWTSLD